jgi:copper transport protein
VGKIRAAIRTALSVVAAALASLAFASACWAHADLLRSSPRDGQVLERSPRAVVLTFDEEIEAAFVRLRVQDAGGRRIDRGAPYHPQRRGEQLAVRLQPGLDGRYFASYRVISADGHPVTRRVAFRVRPPAAADDERSERDEGAMPPPADDEGAMMPPGEDASGHESGAVTSAAFATARGLGYLAMALAIGTIAFLLVVWRPALARTAGAGAEWGRMSERFARRARTTALGAALLGLVAAARAAGLDAEGALRRVVLDHMAALRAAETAG